MDTERPSILAVLNEAPCPPDFTDALEAYTQAVKASDRAREKFEQADRIAQQREDELRAVVDRLKAEEAGDAGT